MLRQHVIDHSAILVTLGFAVDLDHLVDAIHQLGAVAQAQFLHQEVFLDCLKLGRLTACNCRRIIVVDRRTATDGYLCQKVHVRRHATFVLQIVRIFCDQLITFAHQASPFSVYFPPQCGRLGQG